MAVEMIGITVPSSKFARMCKRSSFRTRALEARVTDM
jgi:hypothetical protein